MMEIVKQICSNGIVLFIPIHLWNMIFWKKLPPAFEDKTFDKNIPKTVLIGETVFRLIIFSLPLFTEIDYRTAAGGMGIYIFVTGVIVYFFTWLILIFYPDSKWSKSLAGFCGPGFTPIIWLIGFSLTVNKFNVGLNYTIWFYIVPSVFFVSFHVVHCVLAFENWSKSQLMGMVRITDKT